MNGHVFQCFNETAISNQFAKTVEVLGEYIAKHVKFPGDMSSLTEHLTQPTLTTPVILPTTANELDKILWKQDVVQYAQRRNYLASNYKAVYAVIWGQCSEAVRAKVKSHSEYIGKKAESECGWLLKEIKGIMMSFESKSKPMFSLNVATKKLYAYQQGPNTSMPVFREEFTTLVDIVEHYGGLFVPHTALLETADGDTTEEQRKSLRDQWVGMLFIQAADPRRFGALIADLTNFYSRGNDEWPADLTEAYSMLVGYMPPPSKGGHAQPTAPAPVTTIFDDESVTTGMTFAQARGPVEGTDGTTLPGITCYNCNAKGHYAGECPVKLVTPATQHLQLVDGEDIVVHNHDPETEYGFTFTNVNSSLYQSIAIPRTWLLLDSQSTISIFCNKQLLHNIRQSPTTLKVFTNGGTQDSTLIGDVTNFGTVWYNPESMANILSLQQVRKVCRVTMDTNLEPALIVHRRDGTTMKFMEYSNGLYYFDVAANVFSTSSVNEPSSQSFASLFVQTVSNNKEWFHRREVEGADRAVVLHRKIGRPSQAQFELILRNNLIRNCPVTVDDARRAINIYGTDRASLQGKTVRKTGAHVPTFSPVEVPKPIVDNHKNVTLATDFFFVQGLPFLHTISRKIKFRTVTAVKSRTKAVMLQETRTAIDLYQGRGFNVVDVHADMDFECIKHDIRPMLMNLNAHDDHVGEVERSIRTIKERVCADVHSMLFRRLPKMMIVELVRRAILILNQFPAQDGVSGTLSPLTIMTGKPNPDYHSMKVEFGSYAQVFEENSPTNTNKSRTTGAIALNPTGNAQGDYYFMSLSTWKRLSRAQWTVLPMPDAVITAVESRAEEEKQPLIVGGCPLFEWRPNNPVQMDAAGEIITIETTTMTATTAAATAMTATATTTQAMKATTIRVAMTWTTKTWHMRSTREATRQKRRLQRVYTMILPTRRRRFRMTLMA